MSLQMLRILHSCSIRWTLDGFLLHCAAQFLSMVEASSSFLVISVQLTDIELCTSFWVLLCELLDLLGTSIKLIGEYLRTQ